MENDEKYHYENCVLAYLDVLGFKERVKRSKNNPPEIKKLVKTFRRNDFFKEATEKGDGIPFRCFFFSDSFVFIVKVNEKSIPNLFLIVRYLHDNLLLSGLFLRGAIVSGLLYWPKPDENIILGPGMIKAYDMESTVAIYPRIVISDDLVKYIEDNDISANPLAHEGKLRNFISSDEDGVFFFDILNPKITRKVGEKIEVERINRCDGEQNITKIIWKSGNGKDRYNEIIKKIERYSEKELRGKEISKSVAQKYEWLLSYVKSKGRDAGER